MRERLQIKDVHRRTAMSVVGSFGVQAMLLISGILAARLLGATNRGHLALFLLFVLVLSQIAALGLPLATTQCIARNPPAAREVVTAVTAPALAQSAVVTIFHAVILVAVFGGSNSSVQSAATMTLLATPAVVIHQYVLAVFQGQQRFRAFSVFRSVPSALYSAVLIVALVGHSHALELVTAAWVASLLVTVSAEVFVMRLGLPDAVPAERTTPPRQEMLRFGLKGMLGSIAPLETFNLDQAVVGLFVSPAALGLYVVGLSFTNLPQFLAQSVGYVAYPHVAGQLDLVAARRSIWRFFGATLALCGAVVVLLEVAAPWLVGTLFGRSYASSTTLTRILLLGALFIGLRRVLTDGARGAGYPGLGSAAELISLGCLLPSLALFITDGGVQGAAWAVVLSSAIGFLFLIVTVARGPAQGTSRIIPPGVAPPAVVASAELAEGIMAVRPAGTRGYEDS